MADRKTVRRLAGAAYDANQGSAARGTSAALASARPGRIASSRYR